ncbi:unnamed protein product, partial [Discosporangium mesarthrocarpum]
MVVKDTSAYFPHNRIANAVDKSPQRSNGPVPDITDAGSFPSLPQSLYSHSGHQRPPYTSGLGTPLAALKATPMSRGRTYPTDLGHLDSGCSTKATTATPQECGASVDLSHLSQLSQLSIDSGFRSSSKSSLGFLRPGAISRSRSGPAGSGALRQG